ncbi:MAG: phosphoribosyl-ATP diphosphatase [Rickettsiales bacterium]|nr:phosphoribosyl-ATP diphosphatase [Rickettsiales bacterium]|tara:strand:+ start:479 stop:811 length:333 start_codon:yes stop_codon:yes gene_type:complete
MSNTDLVIDTLFETIHERRKGDPSDSYVAKLTKKGRKKMAQKIAEEGSEVAIAAVAEGNEQIVSESADLLFHLMVLWADAGINPSEVFKELEQRKGVSGITEKANRKDAS